MSHRILSRVIAAAIMVAVVASAINIDHVRRNRLGRDAFMEYQSERYDRYFADPNLEQPIAESLLLCGAFLLIYEIIVFNTRKIVTFMSEAKEQADGGEAP